MKYTEKFLGGFLTYDERDIRRVCPSSFKNLIYIIFCNIIVVSIFGLILLGLYGITLIYRYFYL